MLIGKHCCHLLDLKIKDRALKETPVVSAGGTITNCAVSTRVMGSSGPGKFTQHHRKCNLPKVF